MRILVVDDEIMQLKGLRLGLRTEGHTVVTAQSGEEALEVLKADPLPFELMITDYLMTNMNGIDLLREVRKKASFIPVILMTAYGKKDLLIEAMHNECSGCIEKPFSLEQLVTEITRVKNLSARRSDSMSLDKSLARIVHQINNPLSAIVGTAHIALHCPPDPEATKRRLETILSATDQILEINKKILNLGKGKEDKGPKETLDVKWLLDDCLAVFEGLLAQRQISLEKKMAVGDLPVIGFLFDLQQVFRNLLMNAIEAMDGCRQKLLTVTAETDKTGPWVAVHIGDTGCGVPKAANSEFFNAAKTTKKNGSGIGLQVVKEIVDHHEGQLHMHSQEGQGTVITVKLPAGKSCEAYATAHV